MCAMALDTIPTLRRWSMKGNGVKEGGGDEAFCTTEMETSCTMESG